MIPRPGTNQSKGSLSLRRAWIEICIIVGQCFVYVSLSLRRAWIEIGKPIGIEWNDTVALLTESVD